MLCAMFCSIMVLPALGGETTRPRWPRPIGATRSIDARSDVFRAAVADFHLHTLFGEQRRQVLEQYFVLGVLGASKLIFVDLEQGEIPLAFLGWRILPDTVSPVRRLKRRIWLGET